MKTVVYLLCGLPGSGKTTYAKKLEKGGAIRLTLDEELFKAFGREFPPEKYAEYERRTKDNLHSMLLDALASEESVVLDWGFWKKDERSEYKRLVEKAHGTPRLLYFKEDPDVMKSRLKVRNTADSSANHVISASLFASFETQFEEPSGEGEEIVTTHDRL